MKRLLIIGAGVSQLPLIQTAKHMGVYVIVVSRFGSYPGFTLADKVYYVDTTDADRIADIALAEYVDGVCTTGTDVAVKSVGKVADLLKLNGVSYEAAQLASNKWDMKQAFMEYGVRTAKFVKVRGKEEAYAAFESLSLPMIFKAVDSGGSKGIAKVTDRSQVDYAYDEVMKATKQDFFIVEEFIEGTEFGAQAFVYENKIQFIMPHGDMMFYGDTGVPIGHYVPYELPESVKEDITFQLEQSVRALKLNNCAINADFIIKDQQVYVLEIGSRAGATCLPELVSIYYGFNYYEQMIRAALNMNPLFPQYSTQPCACTLLMADRAGTIIELENRNEQSEDIVQISFDYGVGDAVRKFKVGTDRIGQIIVKGSNLYDVIKRLEEVEKKVNVRLE